MLFRRAKVWVIVPTFDDAYTYDESTGRFSAKMPLKDLLGGDARLYLPVPDDDAIPQAVYDRLVLPMRWG